MTMQADPFADTAPHRAPTRAPDPTTELPAPAWHPPRRRDPVGVLTAVCVGAIGMLAVVVLALGSTPSDRPAPAAGTTPISLGSALGPAAGSAVPPTSVLAVVPSWPAPTSAPARPARPTPAPRPPSTTGRPPVTLPAPAPPGPTVPRSAPRPVPKVAPAPGPTAPATPAPATTVPTTAPPPTSPLPTSPPATGAPE